MAEKRADEAGDAGHEEEIFDRGLARVDAEKEMRQAGADEALEYIEGEDEIARALPEHALNVGRSGVTRAFLQDIDAMLLRHKHGEVDGTDEVAE